MTPLIIPLYPSCQPNILQDDGDSSLPLNICSTITKREKRKRKREDAFTAVLIPKKNLIILGALLAAGLMEEDLGQDDMKSQRTKPYGNPSLISSVWRPPDIFFEQCLRLGTVLSFGLLGIFFDLFNTIIILYPFSFCFMSVLCVVISEEIKAKQVLGDRNMCLHYLNSTILSSPSLPSYN